jgi:plastocyanin
MKDSPLKERRLGWWLMAALGWVLGTWSASATTTNVDIGLYGYSPTDITINLNDTVQWTWVTYYHSSTSTGGLWDSGLQNPPYTYTHTFTSAGSFPYYCTYHYFYGSVTVQSATPPPEVTITNPADGTVLTAPASLVLAATTSGSVTNVEYFQGTTSLGSVATAPYSLPVNGLLANSYTFSAVATDTTGASATNSITISVINPSPLMVSAAKRTSATSFQFNYAADIGLRYVVERSANLKTWVGVDTNTAASNPVLYQDNNAAGAAAYYRVMRMPNP